MTIFECGCSICHTDNNTGDVVRLLAGMLLTLAHPPSLLFGFPCSCAAERGGERGRRAAAGRRDDDFSYGDGDAAADELAELLASMLPSEAAAASAAARAAAAAVVNAAYARETGADAASFARIQRAITNPQARPPARRLAAARGLLRAFGMPQAHPLQRWTAPSGVRVTTICCSRKLSCADRLSVYAEAARLECPTGWATSGSQAEIVNLCGRCAALFATAEPAARPAAAHAWVMGGSRRPAASSGSHVRGVLQRGTQRAPHDFHHRTPAPWHPHRRAP